MGFTGLVPSEYSSGASQHRGHLTKTGNAHLRTQLVESAWAYQHRASIGSRLKQAQAGGAHERRRRGEAAPVPDFAGQRQRSELGDPA